MIRPGSLIRSDDDHAPQIQANATNIRKESLDCGITACGCCNTPGCQKLGTSKAFLTILVLTGILQGTVEAYFRITAKQAALEHEFPPQVVDWLLVSSGICQGLFAIFVAFWGNRFHRTAWLGGLLIFQAVACFIAVIPTLTHNSLGGEETINAIQVEMLCLEQQTGNLSTERPYGITTLVLLFFLQFTTGLANIAFHALGFSYIDDNVAEHESPAFLGAALASKYWGLQFGSALNMGIGITSLGWWLGWVIIGPLIFIVGFVAAMFPRHLLSTVVRRAANDIIEVATNSQLSLNSATMLADTSLGYSFRRMVTNKILMFNVLAMVFLQIAVINFFFYEADYLQSRFLIPTNEIHGLNNEWTSVLVTKMLKPPMIALSVLVAGLIIAKANPNPRKLAAWNIITASITALLFVSYIFIQCNHSELAGARRDKLNTPYCSHSCVCDNNIPFFPICPENSVQTYFSPCHAGCSSETLINDIRISFSNCTCGVDSAIVVSGVTATVGACGFSDCQHYWILFQALTIFAASLLGSGLIGNLIITIRSVLPQDKSLALSIELWLVGLIVYIPGKLGYRAIADGYCQYWASNSYNCHLHENPSFGDLLTIVSAALMAISVIFDIIVFILVKDLPLYGDEPEDSYRPIPLQSMTSNENRYNDDGPESRLLQEEPLIRLAQRTEPTPLIYSIQSTQAQFRSVSPISESPLPPASSPLYSQIQRRAVTDTAVDDHLDFRLQTPFGRNNQDEINNNAINNIRENFNPIPLPPLRIENINNRTTENDDNSVTDGSSGIGSHVGVNAPPNRPTDTDGRPLSPETDF